MLCPNLKWHRTCPEINKNNYNNFSPLQNEIKCSYCYNFGHEEYECRSKIQPKEKISTSSKVSRKKDLQFEICGIDLFAEGEENGWYIDSGCSKHTRDDKYYLFSCNALGKEKNVTCGNESPTIIKGKGSVFLK